MLNWKNSILSQNASIKLAIKSLNKNALQIILAVNDSKQFVGTLTDGDIRRALIKSTNLNRPIKNIINKKPIIALKTASEMKIRNLMVQNNIKQLPIISEKNKKILGLKIWSEKKFEKIKKNKFFIMAGGKGRRLMPYTKNCPKPMLKLRGKPILEHIISKAKIEGFNNFTLSINYLGNKIKTFFKNGSNWDVQIDYINETTPLGTAGSLSLLKPRPKAPFIVCNGDIVTDIKFSEILNFHNLNDADITVAVKIFEMSNPYGVVKLNGNNISGFKEKPIFKSYVNAGVYVINPSIFNYFKFKKNKYLDINELIINLIKKSKKILAYPAYEKWQDIGKKKDYIKEKKKKSN
jgi:dTDP-glucose pyrophosphorylase